MLMKLLHRLAAHPWIYDRIQIAAGHDRVLEWLSKEIAPLSPNVVLDIGGGTGAVRNLFSTNCQYICLDLEMPKLLGFRSTVSSGLAVLGDATSVPISDGCIDMVICKSVTHHLTDLMLEQAFDESRRVLRTNGHLLLFDAVLNRELCAGRLLWRLDRGSYPRTEVELREKFASKFKIIHWEKFVIYHEYVLGIGIRPQ